MDIRKVKKLIELLEESDIDELEIKEGEESVRISRNSKNAGNIFAPPINYAAPVPAPIPTPNTPATEPAATAAPELSGHVVTSPMVGTFYHAPSPDSRPFHHQRPAGQSRRYTLHRLKP